MVSSRIVHGRSRAAPGGPGGLRGRRHARPDRQPAAADAPTPPGDVFATRALRDRRPPQLGRPVRQRGGLPGGAEPGAPDAGFIEVSSVPANTTVAEDKSGRAGHHLLLPDRRHRRRRPRRLLGRSPRPPPRRRSPAPPRRPTSRGGQVLLRRLALLDRRLRQRDGLPRRAQPVVGRPLQPGPHGPRQRRRRSRTRGCSRRPPTTTGCRRSTTPATLRTRLRQGDHPGPAGDRAGGAGGAGRDRPHRLEPQRDLDGRSSDEDGFAIERSLSPGLGLRRGGGLPGRWERHALRGLGALAQHHVLLPREGLQRGRRLRLHRRGRRLHRGPFGERPRRAHGAGRRPPAPPRPST